MLKIRKNQRKKGKFPIFKSKNHKFYQNNKNVSFRIILIYTKNKGKLYKNSKFKRKKKKKYQKKLLTIVYIAIKI